MFKNLVQIWVGILLDGRTSHPTLSQVPPNPLSPGDAKTESVEIVTIPTKRAVN